MESAKFRHVVGRTALATLLSMGIVAATLSLAHAGGWHDGHWGTGAGVTEYASLLSSPIPTVITHRRRSSTRRRLRFTTHRRRR